MMKSARASKPSVRKPCAAKPLLEMLEPRQLMSVTVVAPISNTFVNTGGSATTIDLGASFTDPSITGTVVRLATNDGNIDIVLDDATAPLTVANFLNYVNSHRYDGTVIHRQEPGFVIQGGGFHADGSLITVDPPVQNEFSPSRSNLRGTVAMAKAPGDPNSATSQFFVNLADNSSNLDNQNGGFTVFGTVIDNTMTTADAISALPRVDATAINTAFDHLPVLHQPAGLPAPQDFVTVNTATVIPHSQLFTYTVTSDNPSLVMPSVSNGTLTLNYGAGIGTANVTVTATDPAGGTVQSVFAAGVGELNITVGTGAAKTVSFTQADGAKAAVSLSGPGTATVRFTGSDLIQGGNAKKVTVAGTSPAIALISTTGTSSQSSTLTIKSSSAVNVASITTDAPIRAIVGKRTTLTSNLTTNGDIAALTLFSTTGSVITLGGSGASEATAVGITTATDTTIASNSPILSLKAGSFANTDSTRDTLTAPSIGPVSSKGDFSEDLAITGDVGAVKIGGSLTGNISASTVRSLSVKRDVTASAINLTLPLTPGTKDLGKVKVGGTITGATITSAGDIAAVAAAGLSNSKVFAGVVGTSLPTVVGQFSNASTIASVKTKSLTGSSIAAAHLGKLSLGTITLNNGGVPFGVAADTITSIAAASGPNVRFSFKNLDDPVAFATQLASQGLDLMDFRITVL